MIYYLEDDTNIRDLTVYALRQTGLDAVGFANARDFFAACRETLPLRRCARPSVLLVFFRICRV